MKHFLRSILVLATFIVCIVSCSKPRDKVIPLDRKKWDAELRPIIERLSEEDRQYLRRYLTPKAPGSDAGKNYVPPGTTIADAISEQKSLEAQQRADEEQERQSKEQQRQSKEQQRQSKEQQRQSVKNAQVEAQRRAPIVLHLVEKENNGPSGFKLTFIVANQGEEEIRAVKGNVLVMDAVNEQITSREMTIVGPIPPKEKIQTTAVFIAYQRERWDDNISVAFDLSKVIFSDGSELSVPKLD